MIRLKGRVSSGRALAAQHLAQHRDQLTGLLGASPQPGSLNILLPRPLKLSSESGVWLGKGKHRMVWNAYLEGRRVLLYRWEGCPLSVVEVISEVHFRRELKLTDDAAVSLQICRNYIDKVRAISWLGWVLLWKWRTALYYTSDYEKWVVSLQRYFDGAIGGVTLTKKLGSRVVMLFRQKLRSLFTRNKMNLDYDFVRENPRHGDEGELDRLLNLLNYTKVSGTAYSARKYTAGYHTLILGDRVLKGQRMPSARLDLLPISLKGLTVLDVGCNQGGMLFEAIGRGIRWGVGIDYDPRMVNAANKIRRYRDAENLDFFTFDLEKEPLPLIHDFLPEQKIDLVFLLSVCMWIDNWRAVIEYLSKLAPYMLFESNGNDGQQADQASFLAASFKTVSVLQLTSEDDDEQRNRKLYFCSNA